MISVEVFAYSKPEWDAIKVVVRDELDHDADQIAHHGEPLRIRIEVAAGVYLPQSAINRHRLSREQLKTLRNDAENLRTRVASSLVVQIAVNDVVEPHRFEGVDADMLSATNSYFIKLLDNLGRMSAQAGSSRDNARKTDRDQFWSELLAIWLELGGEPSGVAAARFLLVASKPVMGTVKDDAVLKWLERRRIAR